MPYSHTVYSVGAVYLTVMNLSRSVRYKQKNIILLGIIPGPSEPEHDINNYLQPLVDELLKLWKGVRFMAYLPSGNSNKGQDPVHCYVLHVTCQLAVKCVAFSVIVQLVDARDASKSFQVLWVAKTTLDLTAHFGSHGRRRHTEMP